MSNLATTPARVEDRRITVRHGDDDRRMSIATWAMLAYITIYTFESPVRYALHFAHLSSAILARDLLVLGPVLMLGIHQVFARKLHPAFLVFGLFIGVSFTISVINFHQVAVGLFGFKMLVNVLFGLLAGTLIVVPSKKIGRYLLLLWLATVAGLVLEKYFISFPWVGLHDNVGGIEVEASRDWQIADPAMARVGGFTKMSIGAAGLLSDLALVCLFQYRSYLVRLAILVVTLAGVYLTTAKGAVVGFALVTLALVGPAYLRVPALRVLVIAAVLLVIGLPLLTNGLVLPEGSGGVFSGASFAMRVDATWPGSLKWISLNQIFPLGNGLGGIGQAQALLGSAAEHWPDNMFLLLYAFFGIPAFLLFGWILYAVLRSYSIDPAVAAPALAILAFELFDGSIVSVVEDQCGALFIGAAMGVLLYARRSPIKSISQPRRGIGPSALGGQKA